MANVSSITKSLLTSDTPTKEPKQPIRPVLPEGKLLLSQAQDNYYYITRRHSVR